MLKPLLRPHSGRTWNFLLSLAVAFAVFSCLETLTACKLKTASADSSVLNNGNEDAAPEFSPVVLINAQIDASPTQETCSSNLIKAKARYWLLTAAHCVLDAKKSITGRHAVWFEKLIVHLRNAQKADLAIEVPIPLHVDSRTKREIPENIQIPDTLWTIIEAGLPASAKSGTASEEDESDVDAQLMYNDDLALVELPSLAGHDFSNQPVLIRTSAAYADQITFVKGWGLQSNDGDGDGVAWQDDKQPFTPPLLAKHVDESKGSRRLGCAVRRVPAQGSELSSAVDAAATVKHLETPLSPKLRDKAEDCFGSGDILKGDYATISKLTDRRFEFKGDGSYFPARSGRTTVAPGDSGGGTFDTTGALTGVNVAVISYRRKSTYEGPVTISHAINLTGKTYHDWLAARLGDEAFVNFRNLRPLPKLVTPSVKPWTDDLKPFHNRVPAIVGDLLQREHYQVGLLCKGNAVQNGKATDSPDQNDFSQAKTVFLAFRAQADVARRRPLVPFEPRYLARAFETTDGDLYGWQDIVSDEAQGTNETTPDHATTLRSADIYSGFDFLSFQLQGTVSEPLLRVALGTDEAGANALVWASTKCWPLNGWSALPDHVVKTAPKRPSTGGAHARVLTRPLYVTPAR